MKTTITFNDAIKMGKRLFESPIICFQGSDYPLLFFKSWFALVNGERKIESLAHYDGSVDQLTGILQVTFLGLRNYYWLGNLSTMDARSRKKALTFLATYNGPHTVVFFLDDKDSFVPEHGCVVAIPAQVEATAVATIAPVVSSMQNSRAVALCRAACTRAGGITLDQVILFAQYGLLLGARTNDFSDQWLSRMVKNQSSLFTLSQHFFARNKREFYSSWARLSSVYPEPFWISYWSEQIWRAYHFIRLRTSDPAQAKKISYRLPFSFIKTDWSRIKAEELKKTQQLLYNADYAIKNSAKIGQLDLIYAQFINHSLAD